jgi:hypothetical protein
MNFRLLAFEDKLRKCAEILLESLSCLTLDEQKDLARFLVPEVGNNMIFRIESITCLTLPNTTNNASPPLPNFWEEQFRTDELSNINKLNLGFLL